MGRLAFGLAALLAMPLMGPALAEDMTEEIQESEQPGSEIEMDIGPGGNVDIGREGEMREPLEPDGDTGLQPLDDPDDPVEPDPIDAELPGEGPEDLSGPMDEDPLPD